MAKLLELTEYLCFALVNFYASHILINILKCMLHRYDRLLREVTIALVGKYTKLEDAYASVIKALQHSALAASHRLNLKVNSIVLQTPFLLRGRLLS